MGTTFTPDQLEGDRRWTFPAQVTDIVDGDTLDLTFDLGFSTHLEARRIRLLGVDTAEVYGVAHSSAQYETGVKHTQWVMNWIEAAMSGATDQEFPFEVVTIPDGDRPSTGKYGRYLGVIYRTTDAACLQTDLITEFPNAASPTDDGSCDWCGKQTS